MSELQISDQLIESVLKTLADHDQRANEHGIAVQYLAAIIGFILGKQDFPGNEKREFLDQLYAFSQHVLDDIDDSQDQPPAAPPQEAFGIWKPD